MLLLFFSAMNFTRVIAHEIALPGSVGLNVWAAHVVFLAVCFLFAVAESYTKSCISALVNGAVDTTVLSVYVSANASALASTWTGVPPLYCRVSGVPVPVHA